MGNGRKFNFDLYVDELLTEALSPAQMQDQIRNTNLDPAKYDQNHLLFLVGLINSNQGIEVYDELLHKIKDKGLLKSLLSVSINDRRSDKPTIDMDKITRALQYYNDPDELRSIISGQKREIVKTEEPVFDSSKLKEFLSKNGAEDLLEILIKLRAEVDNTLELFVSEYNQAEDDIKRYVKTNAHRATDVLKLAGILHEAKSKMLNPFNASTTLTVDDLRKESDFYNLEKNFYIVRTTYPDDPSKSLKLNLKFGQGNRFGLCIASKNENYYLHYRTDQYLTTHFVYRLADPSLDKNNINNYNIAIIDSIRDPNDDEEHVSGPVSYNPVATMTNLDPLEFKYENEDTTLGDLTNLYRRLDHIFQEDSLNLTSRDNKGYVLNTHTFFKIFTPLDITPHEQRLGVMVDLNQDEFEDEFLAISPKDQIVVLINGGLDKIDGYLFNKLSPEVRDFFVKNVDTIKDIDLYNQYTEKEKQGYKTRKINQINKQYESYKKESNEAFHQSDYKDDQKDIFMEIYPSSKVLEKIKGNVDLNVILENPEYRKTFIEPQIKLAGMLRQEILDQSANGIYEGHIGLQTKKYMDSVVMSTRPRDLKLYLVLPDLSDLIINGSLDISYMKLSSLKGCPRVIHSSFHCNSNNLTSLEHGPEVVGMGYYAYNNSLQTLKGCAKKIGKTLDIKKNKQLKNLEGCPEIVYDFYANNCGLETLKGGPKISRIYNVTNNNLKNLHYGPEYIKEAINFGDNPIENLEGFPKYFSGHSDVYKLSIDSKKKIGTNLGMPEDVSWTVTDYLVLRLLNHVDFEVNDKETERVYKGSVWDRFDNLYKKHIDELKNTINQAKLDYKNSGVKLNRESVIYSLLKSYLLRS